jgi:hypothetical protein
MIVMLDKDHFIITLPLSEGHLDNIGEKVHNFGTDAMLHVTQVTVDLFVVTNVRGFHWSPLPKNLHPHEHVFFFLMNNYLYCQIAEKLLMRL